MALIRKFINRNTYLSIVGIWNALAIYIPVHFHWSAETIALIVTVGNLVIAWIGVESEQGKTVQNNP